MVLKIVEDFQPDYMVACFDLPEPTYRHDAFADYKGKREKTDDTLVSQIIRSRDIFAAFGIPIYEMVGFEADDLLGTIAFQTKNQKDLEVIIASGDMDTMQCVDGKRVQVYTLKKGIKDTIMYDEAAVKERFGFGPKLVPDYKGLRGDTSDNIPGIVGIGEKTATELIVGFGGIDAIYKKLKKGEEAFLEAGIKPRIVKLLKEGEEEARFSKMLATIREDVPVTFELPAQSWREEADPERIITLFSELGFRTLGTRVRTALQLSPEAVIEASTAGISNEEVHETGILLWLLESERTNPTFEDIIDYGRAYLETSNFAEIKAKLLAKIEAEAGLKYVYEKIEKPLQEAIATINKTGIALDVPYLKTLAAEMHTELDALKLSIYEQAGMEFNINSPKQLGEILFDALALKPKNQKKTAGGQRSTKESELEKLRDEHPIIPLLLRYRELQKLVSTYADTLPLQVSEDGRIRTTFLQTGTTTGRMGSRDPNLQNIPVRTKESIAIRRAFVADKGYTMVGIDYSQIELRIAAIMSHDEKLIDIFNRGEDVHTGVAVRVFGVDPSEVTSEMRRKAKVINFGILYGMGVNALRANLGGDTSREEAQQFLNAYFNTFTRLAEYLEETKQYARDNGYTETLFGRRRHFPGISSNAPFIRAQAERMAINAPIQGTAADVMRIAMNEVYGYLKDSQKLGDIRMLLQVHDELVFEIAEKEVDSAMSAIQAHMTDVVKLKIPLQVSIGVGKNWDEASAH